MLPSRPFLIPAAFLAAAGTSAAAPEIGIRSVTNGVTLEDAPSAVPRGGILAILGEGLAAAHVAADTLPLPTVLGDPAVQVLIEGRAVPLFFVAPQQINAQVPWEIEAGRASVVVRQGDTDSAVTHVQVTDLGVALMRHAGTGALIAESAADPEEPPAEPAASQVPIDLGSPAGPPSAADVVLDPAAEISSGQVVRVFAAGIGETAPALVTGSPGAADTPYELVQPQRAFLGGVPVENLSIAPSESLVGVYGMRFAIPEPAGGTEVFRWVSGNDGASGVMGPVGPPSARYLAVPEGVTAADRIQLSDLNPYFVSLGGTIDDDQGCYTDVHLMDFRRDSVTTLTECLFPSWPNAPNPNNQYQPFEAPANSSVLAAIVAPAEAPAAGLSDQLLLVDTAAGTMQTVAIEGGADRLQTGAGNSSTLRLERPGGADGRLVVDLQGTVVGEAGSGNAALPDEVDGLSVDVAQGNQNYPGGYRLRFLGPASDDGAARPHAVLFDAEGNAVATEPFPAGWVPIAPPRRRNPAGNPVGGPSLAPATGAFGDETTAFVIVRSEDSSMDGVASFQVTLPDPDADPEATPAPAASVAATATAFPDGVYAANCTTGVRWLRMPAARKLAIAGSGEALTEFAEPRDGRICASDRLLVFDPATGELAQSEMPDGERLDVWLRGAVNSYVYFGDATREVPYKASTKIHVFDGATASWTEIAFPLDAEGNQVGISYNNPMTQGIGSESKLVALATVGETRTNNQGLAAQPFPGSAGLLVVDLEQATATHLPLPEGFTRIEAGNNQLVQQGRRGFGMLPLTGRAFANARRAGAPPGTGIVTWDVATGEATVIELPEEAYATVRPLGGQGGGQRPFLWDVSAESGAFAFGVYNRGRDLIGVGVVGP